MRETAALMFLCACSFHGGTLVDSGVGSGGDDGAIVQHAEAGTTDDGPPLDGPPDAFVFLDAPAAAPCYGNSWWKVCLVATPVGLVDGDLHGAIDTGTAACVALTGANSGACVLVYKSITVSNDLVVTGAKPLVLVAASGDINVTGGHVLASTAHADAAACAAQTPVPEEALASGGGGGYGGSFIGGGGNGSSRGGGSGGNPGPAISGALGVLRGGCPGGDGQPNSAANGGHGGGVLVAIASGAIKVPGSVRAVGGAGGGGNTSGGGAGGGGSGGLIVLDAATITVTGSLLAGGGGGGEGYSSAAGNPGTEAGANTNPQGQGGTGGAGADGGAGSSMFNATGADASAVANAGLGEGGGGAGGGAGAIVTHGTATSTGATLNPATTAE